MNCSECGRSKRVLTKEGLCAYCHKNKTGEWPREFSDGSDDKK